jgi:hypothetical protein
MLAMALFLSSCLGIFQEETYKLYGKKWREGLFYCVRPTFCFRVPADEIALPQSTILLTVLLFTTFDL